jgi:enamine deaminase RidA (YjgF/YER057c/UK114 family)
MRHSLLIGLITTLTVASVTSSPSAAAEYDKNLAGPEARASLLEQQKPHGWTRIPSYKADGVTLSRGANEALRNVILNDSGYAAWSQATGLTLDSFTYLQLRDLDVARNETTVLYDEARGLFRVKIPFAAGIRYVTSNVLKQGTLFISGQMASEVGPNGPLTVQILSFNDSQSAEAFSRHFTPLLNAFDGMFAASVAAPGLRAQLSDVASLREWLDASGATERLVKERASLQLR